MCLESTLGWGLLALFIFGVFNRDVETAVKLLDVRVAGIVGGLLAAAYLFDFGFQFMRHISSGQDRKKSS